MLITPYIGYYTHALFLLLYVRPRPTLAPSRLRAHIKSIESHTRTVSSRITLAKHTRQERTAGIKITTYTFPVTIALLMLL